MRVGYVFEPRFSVGTIQPISMIFGILNPIQTGLFWSICDWGGGGLLGPPLCISGTNNARVMKFTHNDHLRTKKPHTQF